MLNFIKNNFWGILVSLVIGLAAYYLSQFTKGINEVILAFFIAVLIGNFVKLPSQTKEGVNFSSSKLLEYAIIFMAFSISFQSIATLGWSRFLFVLVIVIAVLLVTILLAKLFKTKDSTAYLVGFGTAICGSSAIAALAPSVSKNKEDAGIAIAVVNLLGSLGMIVLPFLLTYLYSLSTDPAILAQSGQEDNIGFILGASLQSIGNVAGAGYALSQKIGDSALTVKLARVALLSPAVILFSYFVNKEQSTSSGEKVKFSLPYYLWIFVGITLLNSLITIPENLLASFKEIGKILLTISMAAIGLKVSFKTLWFSGKNAIGFGSIIFIFQILLAYLLVILF